METQSIFSTLCLLVTLSVAHVIATYNYPDYPDCPYPSDETTYLSVPGNCSLFIECKDGRGKVFICPSDLWWNPNILKCDYPGSYCDETPTTTTTTTTTPEPTEDPLDPRCPFPSSDTIYLPVSGECGKYLICFNGMGYEKNCPDGLWWHPKVNSCDLPGDYCVPETTVAPWTPDPRCPVPSEKDTYWPVTGDCTSYLHCSNGIAVELHCPNGLWWHQEIQTCDLPNTDFCKN